MIKRTKEDGMTKLFITTMSTTRGPGGPEIRTSYQRILDEAYADYQDCLNDLDEVDPSTVLLVEVDLETLQETVIDSFQGNLEDLDNSYEREEDEV